MSRCSTTYLRSPSRQSRSNRIRFHHEQQQLVLCEHLDEPSRQIRVRSIFSFAARGNRRNSEASLRPTVTIRGLELSFLFSHVAALHPPPAPPSPFFPLPACFAKKLASTGTVHLKLCRRLNTMHSLLLFSGRVLPDIESIDKCYTSATVGRTRVRFRAETAPWAPHALQDPPLQDKG